MFFSLKKVNAFMLFIKKNKKSDIGQIFLIFLNILAIQYSTIQYKQ